MNELPLQIVHLSIGVNEKQLEGGHLYGTIQRDIITKRSSGSVMIYRNLQELVIKVEAGSRLEPEFRDYLNKIAAPYYEFLRKRLINERYFPAH